MQTREKLAVAAGAALLAFPLLVAAFLPREPEYHGLTTGEWLQRPNDVRSDEALLILGTNNLHLLVRRVDYDPQKDLLRRALHHLPSRFRNTPLVVRLTSRGVTLRREAIKALSRMGTNAEPAIPTLAAIVERFGRSSDSALAALSSLGDDRLALLAGLLAAHPEPKDARAAITNALNDPDPLIRSLAQFYATNQSWQPPDYAPLRDRGD